MGSQTLEQTASLQESSPELRVEVCSDDAAIQRARAAWRDLADRSATYSASQTPDYAIFAWEGRRRPDDVALAVVLIWRGERLVCAWPLYTSRRGGLRVATHLGAGGNEEYSGPLLDEGDQALAIAALALKAAMGLADVLEVYAVHPDSAIVGALKSARGWRYENNALHAPVVTLTAASDFESWVMGKSRSFRQGLRADRKRLAEQGAVRLVQARGRAEAATLVDWIFESKRGWLAARGITHSWLLEPEGRELLTRLIARPESSDQKPDVLGFGLKLDDKFLAAGVFFRSPSRLEFFVSGFDPDSYAFSPGNLLIEDCVRWAIPEGLDLDFRTTQDAYKLRWADRQDTRETHILACSTRGGLRILRYELNRLVRRARIAGSDLRKRYLASKKTTVIAPKS